MTTKTEHGHAGGFLISELPGLMSRKAGTLNAGQNLYAGAVLGRAITPGAATAVGSPVGTGAVTVSAVVGEDVQIGRYRLVCVAAASNAGTFNLYAPDGTLVRQITVAGGATSSSHLTITIADAQDYAVGDEYYIDVAGGDYTAINFSGTDGSQNAAGLLWDDTDATDADTACTVVDNQAAINSGEIVWPDAATAAQKNAAIAQLAARGLIMRPAVTYS